MTYIGRKFVPSHVIQNRMDKQDLRYQQAAAAKVREHAEAQGTGDDGKSWNEVAADVERTRYRPVPEQHGCDEPGCDQAGVVYFGRDSHLAGSLRFVPHAYRCLAHADEYRRNNLVIERT